MWVYQALAAVLCVAATGCTGMAWDWIRTDGQPADQSQLQIAETICGGDVRKAKARAGAGVTPADFLLGPTAKTCPTTTIAWQSTATRRLNRLSDAKTPPLPAALVDRGKRACSIVRDGDKQALACVYFENESGRRSSAKLLTREEAFLIAVNIAKLPSVPREILCLIATAKLRRTVRLSPPAPESPPGHACRGRQFRSFPDRSSPDNCSPPAGARSLA